MLGLGDIFNLQIDVIRWNCSARGLLEQFLQNYKYRSPSYAGAIPGRYVTSDPVSAAAALLLELKRSNIAQRKIESRSIKIEVGNTRIVQRCETVIRIWSEWGKNSSAGLVQHAILLWLVITWRHTLLYQKRLDYFAKFCNWIQFLIKK